MIGLDAEPRKSGTHLVFFGHRGLSSIFASHHHPRFSSRIAFTSFDVSERFFLFYFEGACAKIASSLL